MNSLRVSTSMCPSIVTMIRGAIRVCVFRLPAKARSEIGCRAADSTVSDALCARWVGSHSMLIAKFIRVNLALIVVVGFYGMVTDEPYWRDVGHGPWLYDYLFWFALILNGPSGFTAEYLSWLGSSDGDSRFVIQYALWCALLSPQWRLYHGLALWCRESRSKQMVLYSLVIFFTLAGGAGAYKGWLVGHRPSEFFVDKYFWFVRVASLGCSALVLLCLYVVTREPRRID